MTVATTGATWSADAVDRVGRFVFRYRDYLVPVTLLAVVLLTRPQAAGGRLDGALEVIGFAVAALGQALRMTVIGFAYIQRGGAKKQLSAPTLVCEGIYAHSRNPMYVGNFLLLVGLLLMYNAPAAYVILLPVYAAALLAMVRAEERFLAERFGAQYAAYADRVNRFIPSVRGLRATLAPMRFDWRRVVRKEYGTTFAWLSMAFFILAWKRIERAGWPAAAPELRILLCWYAPIPVLYGIARWLKKSKRLRSAAAG
jgi:protein-S-isoprenylcysteine O-methyltransferase Ste14